MITFTYLVELSIVKYTTSSLKYDLFSFSFLWNSFIQFLALAELLLNKQRSPLMFVLLTCVWELFNCTEANEFVPESANLLFSLSKIKLK